MFDLHFQLNAMGNLSASEARNLILYFYDRYGDDLVRELVVRMSGDEAREFIDHFKNNWDIES